MALNKPRQLGSLPPALPHIAEALNAATAPCYMQYKSPPVSNLSLSLPMPYKHTLFKSKLPTKSYYTHSKMVFFTKIVLLVASAAVMVSAGPVEAPVVEAVRSVDVDTRGVTDASDPKLQKRNGLLYCGHFPSTS